MKSFSIALVFAVFAIFAAKSAHSQAPASQIRGLRPAGQADPVNQLRTGRNYALIIATDDYDDKSWPHLQNPVDDARNIAEELRKNYGYNDPDLLINARLEDVTAKLAGYLDKKFEKSDSLLIFFAGHGKFDERLHRGYLVFRNSMHSDPLNRSYLSYSDLSNTVDAIGCGRILLMIDACFGGTFDNQIALRGGSDLQYPQASRAEILARKSGLTTRLFLTSGGKEYVPDGRPGAHSPFASQILRALRTYGGDSGIVTFQDVFQQVDRVTLNNPQYGWFGRADPGSDFWFARSSNPSLERVETVIPMADKRVAVVPAASYDFRADRDILPFSQGTKWGLVNRQGTVILQPGYDSILPFSEKQAVVRNNGMSGAIDLRGRIVVPLEFAFLGHMREGLAPACKEKEKCGYIDRSGAFVVQPIYKSANYFSNGMALVEEKDGRRWFIDHSGRQIFDAVRTHRDFSEDRVGAWDENNRFGFKNKSGDWVIQPQFDSVSSFYRGLAPVKIDGKWKFIDTTGHVRFSSDADDFSDGAPPLDSLIRAKRGGKWGFTDQSGKWIIQPSFNVVDWGFLNGVAQVTVAEGRGWIDEKGNWDVKPGAIINAPDRTAPATPRIEVPTSTRNKVSEAPTTNEGTKMTNDMPVWNSVPLTGFRLYSDRDNQPYIWIPPGNFTMGCSPGDEKCSDNEKPSHREQIAKGFWMGQTEVTQGAWEKVNQLRFQDDPSHFQRADGTLPVENVDWNQAVAYCKAVGGRLPSEKEWEYAARGGTTTALGINPDEPSHSKFPVENHAWYASNSNGRTHVVGDHHNHFNLADMLGNVWEWTDENYRAQGNVSSTGEKVVRGGSWMDTSDRVRVSSRLAKPPSYKGAEVGFRCVQDWPPPKMRVD